MQKVMNVFRTKRKISDSSHEMRDMMKILLERNIMSQGEGSNPSMHKGGGGDKTPGRDGGNGASPPPSPPPSSSSSSSSSSTSSKNLPHSPKGHGKTPSQIPSLKLDIKFELPIYNGEVNAEKLDNWIRQIEVYSRIQKIQDDETKIQLASLRLDGSALIWWESKTQEEIKKNGKILLSWNDFIIAIKKQFYPLAYKQKATMEWQNFRQAKGQNVQSFTQEFRRRALVLGVDLSSQETLLKYIGALHSYLRHTILMFNPTNLDEVCVQATHLEARGNKDIHEGFKKTFSQGDKGKKHFKGKGRKNATVKKEGEKFTCKHCSKEGHDEDHCWKLHPERRPKKFGNNNKGKSKTVANVVQDLGSDSGDETKITAMSYQGNNSVASTSSSSNANVNVTQQEKTRIELFHIRVISKHTKIDTLFDSGSQANLISEETVKKLKLETSPHPKPYPLGWICDNAKLQVTRKCKLRFAITANFVDEVELDVIPLDICGIVLGSPYLYDRKAIFYRQENKYHLFKDEVEYVVRAHTKKMNLSVINAGQMKRLVNASKNFVLLMIKPKNDVENEAFQGCDSKLKSSLFEVVNQYDDMFKEPKGLPPKRGIQHEIQLQQDCPLPNIGMYRMSVMENTEIKKQIQELLDKGVIVPSSSPCGSPIVLVPKKDGTWRMCVDFRALNKITIKNRYPLPRIDDLLDQLKDAKYFTKLDLRSGYHQIRIAEGDTWKTTFKTKQGLFEWMVMPFGLCNAPATFMRVMNDVLRPFLDDFVIVYLDDILIFSKSREEHIEHVKKILDVLRKEQLFLKLSKCEFGKTSLIYLGHIVGGGELKIDPSKVKVILEWSRPSNVTEVRSFLGAAQYWRKFIANFSSIAAPLHALTSVKQGFQWGGKQQQAFDTLKEKISSAPVLALPNLRQPFEIQTDASHYAMGAVLLQYGKPICFHSETFNGVVINYPTYDKELYALVQSVKKWKHYLLGKETIIHTDHQPLQYLQSQSKLQQARHFRWMGFLQQFHLVIKYKKGVFNKVADMLSRPIVSASVILKQSPIMHESYVEQYALDADFKDVYETLCHSNHVEELDYHLHNNLLYHLGKLCIPQGERINIIREAHSSLIAGHFGVGKTVANLQRFCYWPKMNESVSRYVRGCSLCATSKPSNRKLGLYTPLPVPSRPWESISMDFVGGLPMSRKGHDYLYVVVDRFSKMCILMPCTKQVTTEQTTQLFFQNVWVHFGLPKSIISDRDSRFVGSFWSSLWALMDTKLKKSTAFHPQTDGQTEVVNRTVVHLLRAYCSKHPKLWDEHLHYVQHAYNRAKHSSTQMSPFETCFGYLPKSPLDFIFGKDIVVDGQYDIDRAEKFIEQIQSIHQVVQEQLEKSQAKYKARHDKHRVDHSFEVGDEVWLYISKERLKGEGKKLKPIRYGPFKIIDKIGNNAFRLDLPPYMQMYAVVNVENLKLYEPPLIDDQGEHVQIPSIDDFSPEYLTELQEDTILDRRMRTSKRGNVEYLRVGLKGMNPSKAKWIEVGRVRELYPHLHID
jgi:hypothetical protein